MVFYSFFCKALDWNMNSSVRAEAEQPHLTELRANEGMSFRTVEFRFRVNNGR